MDSLAIDVNQKGSIAAELSEFNRAKTLFEGFQKSRELSKKKHFSIVARLGICLLLIGIFGFIALIITHPTNDITKSIVFALCFGLFVSGSVTISTIATNQLDLDTLMNKFYGLRFSTSLILIFASLSQTSVPPCFGYALAVVSATISFPRFFSWDYFTYKVSIFLIGWIIILDSQYLYFAIISKYNLPIMKTIDILGSDSVLSQGISNFIPYLLLSTFLSLSASITIIIWFQQHQLYWSSNALKGADRTTALYIALFGFIISMSAYFIITGCTLAYYDAYPPLDDPNYIRGNFLSYGSIATGIEFFIPPFLVILFGRERVFNYMGRVFDRNPQTLLTDGVFMAELLEITDIDVGQPWWIHYDTCIPPRAMRLEYELPDHRQRWYRGEIVRIDEHNQEMSVALITNDSSTLSIKKSSPHKFSEKAVLPMECLHKVGIGMSLSSIDLLEAAQRNLRCIDWEMLTEDLFVAGSVRDASAPSYYSYSRLVDVDKGERIDFFISHSWSDDGALKYSKITEVVEEYHKEHGSHRDPTFWFDKVCIDQSNIGAGLKVLPINVMACKCMLLLCGPTYPTRLWCIWELYTLFSFVSVDLAIERLKLAPLSDVHQLHEGKDNAPSLPLMQALLRFDVTRAHCYDPNEERKLMKVIEANGLDSFNARVRELATRSLDKMSR